MPPESYLWNAWNAWNSSNPIPAYEKRILGDGGNTARGVPTVPNRSSNPGDLQAVEVTR